MILSRSGRVHLTYTWRRRNIQHLEIDPGELEVRPYVDGRWPD